jgi:hypothetical protein
MYPAELKELLEKNDNSEKLNVLINEFENSQKFRDLLDFESDINIYKITESSLPDNLTPNQISLISWMIAD